MYLAIIILPLLGSIASGFFGRKIGVSGAQVITCLAVVLTTLLAVVAFFEVGYNNIPVSIEVFRWIDSESLNVWWGFHFDLLTVSTSSSRQGLDKDWDSLRKYRINFSSSVLKRNFHTSKVEICSLSKKKYSTALDNSTVHNRVMTESSVKNVTNYNKLLALIVAAFWFLFVSSLLGLNIFFGFITAILFIFIAIHLRGLIGESNNITRVILSLFIMVEVILLYYLVDMSIPANFYSNYPSLTYGIVLFFYLSTAKMIFFAVYSKNSDNYFSNLINLLIKLFTLFKSNPLSLLIKLLGFLCILFLANVLGNILGITVSTITFFLFIFTLVCKISYFSLLVLIYRFPKINNKEEFYNIVGMSPYLPICLIPFSYFYFFCILPKIIMLHQDILVLANTGVEKFIGLLTFLNLKYLVFNKVKELGQFLVSMPNRPGQLGRFLVGLSDWILANKLDYLTRKQFIFANYNPIMLWDPLANVKKNIIHWNYIKSKPEISPMKIIVPMSKLAGLNHFVSVKGSLNSIYKNFFKNQIAVLELFSKARNCKISKITLRATDNIIQFDFKDQYSSADIKVINSEGKPKYYSFNLMTYIADLDKKECMDNIVKNYRKDLQVFMQNNFSYRGPNTGAGPSLPNAGAGPSLSNAVAGPSLPNAAAGPDLPLQSVLSHPYLFDRALMMCSPNIINTDLESLVYIDSNTLSNSPNYAEYMEIKEQFKVVIEDLNSMDEGIIGGFTSHTALKSIIYRHNALYNRVASTDVRKLLAVRFTIVIASIKVRLDSPEYSAHIRRLESMLEHLVNELESLKSWHPTRSSIPLSTTDYLNQATGEELDEIEYNFRTEMLRRMEIHAQQQERIQNAIRAEQEISRQNTLGVQEEEEENNKITAVLADMNAVIYDLDAMDAELEETRIDAVPNVGEQQINLENIIPQTPLQKPEPKIKYPYGRAWNSPYASTIFDLETRTENRVTTRKEAIMFLNEWVVNIGSYSSFSLGRYHKLLSNSGYKYNERWVIRERFNKNIDWNTFDNLPSTTFVKGWS